MLYIIVGTLRRFDGLQILLSGTRVCGGKNTDGEPNDYFEFNKEFTRYWIYNIYNIGTTTTAGPDVMTNVLVQNCKEREREKNVINNESTDKGP